MSSRLVPMEAQPAQLAEAILSNSLAAVSGSLKAGASAKQMMGFDALPLISQVTDESGDIDDDNHSYKAALDNRQSFCFPLHLAVVNLYLNLDNPSTKRTAFNIIDLLLKHGADPGNGCRGLVLFDIPGYQYHAFPSPVSARNRPVHLAMFYKKKPVEDYETETHEVMEAVIDELQRAMESKSKTKKLQKTAPVMVDTINVWKSLLFSEKFSDITFQCPDGESVPAHRCVLAGASPYFATALDGPWMEANSGIWETSHSSAMIKAILTLVYTGVLPKEIVNSNNTLEFFDVASEFDVKPAIAVATNFCMDLLNLSNVKSILQVADLHNNRKLKKACFEFIQTNAARVLILPNIIALCSEDPVLWEELTLAIDPSTKNRSSKKRARTSDYSRS